MLEVRKGVKKKERKGSNLGIAACATRQWGKERNKAVLDLVLGNEPGQVSDLSVGEHFGDSDHNSISFTLAIGER